MGESKLEKAVKMSFDEWSASVDEGLKKDRFKVLRVRSGMSQNQFAKYFNIPPSTLKKWEQGQRHCPEYLLDLIEYKLKTQSELCVIFRDSMDDACEILGYVVGFDEADKYCDQLDENIEFEWEEHNYLQIKNLIK